MNTLLANAESSIDASTKEGVEIHMIYLETACSLIKEVKSPEKTKFEPRIMSLLMANQNSIKDDTDPRWSILFDCWISILEVISTIPEVPRDGVLKIINSGMQTIMEIQDSQGKEGEELENATIDYSVLVKSLQLLAKLSVNQLGTSLPNTEKYIKYCLNCVSNLVDENVRIEACSTLPELLSTIKHSNKDPEQNVIKGLAKVILKVTIFSCTLEIKPHVICRKMESLCEVLALCPSQTFTQPELNALYKIIL